MKNQWLTMSDEELDNFFRRGLKRHKISFDETSWISMKIKLNRYCHTQQPQIAQI